jgi:uncharacterized protein (TIGR03083 family)
VDYTAHFSREARAFLAATRRAADAGGPAPAVPSCPGWTLTDLVLHLGYVHRSVARTIAERLRQQPEWGDLSWLGLEPGQLGWLRPGRAPAGAPLPANLPDWFAAGASALEGEFRSAAPGQPVWTWSAEQTVGFWQRMQSIEAAVHRWDAEKALGRAQPVDAELAANAVVQTFTVMAPMRRTYGQAPPGEGERFRFIRTDGTGDWAVEFRGEDVTLVDPSGPTDLTLAGTASDLMLYLWQRLPPESLDLRGDTSLLGRYFVLVPPL